MLLLCLLVSGACVSGGSNWDPLAEPVPEPNLPAGYDPNDPYDVYRYGETVLRQAPDRAASAFYRASRLDPLWADPIYAWRTAAFMTNPDLFYDYLFNRRQVRNVPGVARLDSLMYRALSMNPFLQRKYDVIAIKHAWVTRIEKELRQVGAATYVSRSDIEYVLDEELSRANPEVRARIAEGDGRLGVARDLYDEAARWRKNDPDLWADLARVQFLTGAGDAALKSYETALALLREKDDEELVRLYQPKMLLEFSIGMVLEERGDVEGARSAYARALQEDLSYAPAHIRLAELALEAGDTATALSEFALAVSVAPDDAGIRYRNGSMLARVGMLEEAEAELRQSIELEPLFAEPYRELGEVLERQGRLADAAAAYREYLARASRRAEGRAEIERRLQRLAAAGGGR